MKRSERTAEPVNLCAVSGFGEPFSQYIYISTGKMAAIDPGETRRVGVGGALGVELPLVSVKVQTSGGVERSAEFRLLDELRKKIAPTALDFADPRLRPGDWCRFDMRMSWGTLHKDSALPGTDRVVAITGPAPWPQPMGSTELVLLGSTCHLRDRVGSAGRMGSTSNTLYDLASDTNLLKIYAPSDARGGVSSEWDWKMSDAAGSLTRIIDHYRPRWQRERLEGLAQILHTYPEGFVTKLVVATPLYVRRVASPLAPAESVRRLRRFRELLAGLVGRRPAGR